MNDRICPGCGKVIGDDDTILRTVANTYWHISCHDFWSRQNRLMEPKMNEMDPAAWAKWSAASGAKPVRVTDSYPTINYTITPRRFMLEIPVEALANLGPDAQTRVLNMLNAWIIEHKPPRTRDDKVSKP